MQRTEMVALVAGTTVGIGGGALGAFLVCTAGRVVVHHFLDQFDDEYLDLRPPTLLTARHGAQQTSVAGASVTQLHREQSPSTAPTLS
jgi:hypothetical protein